MAKQTKEVAKVESKAMATVNLDELSEFSDAYNVRSSILKPPTLKLAQALTPEVVSGMCRPGEYFCSMKEENYSDSVKIIPLMISESASLMHPQDSSEDGIKCYTRDLVTNFEGVACTKCPHNSFYGDWGPNNTAPACKMAFNIICLVEKDGEIDELPLVISFRKTSYKAGKELARKIATHPRRIPFLFKYSLKSASDKNAKNQIYYVTDSSMHKEKLTDEEVNKVVPIAKWVLEMKKKGSIEIEHDDNENTKEANTNDVSDIF